MIDWNQILGFEWDDGNARKNAQKHSVIQPEAEQVFWNKPLVVQFDRRHSTGESRFHALGITDGGRRLHITFTIRAAGTRLRVISARDMHRKERAIYEQAAEDTP